MQFVVYVVIFGGLGVWAALDAKKRIANGATVREVGGHPISIFAVVLIAPLIGGLFYLYKRNKDYSKSVK